MSTTKTLLLFLLTGALLGAAVTTWIAPGTYIWWATPGSGTGQELLVRADVIRETVAWLVKWQAIGAAIGAGLFLVLGLLWVRAQAKRAKSARQAASIAAPAAARQTEAT
ncbi:MAG: hypothetical protein L0Y66_02285 [Myxococcaceae bacterium]|nr:hypothetical protein [Myxococcaceae bacterium]MCI0672115.1 hypothetical protein [Myxococcaceae bacterium]